MASASANLLVTLILDVFIFTVGVVVFLLLRRFTRLFGPKFYHMPYSLQATKQHQLRQVQLVTAVHPHGEQQVSTTSSAPVSTFSSASTPQAAASNLADPNSAEFSGRPVPLTIESYSSVRNHENERIPGDEIVEVLQDEKNRVEVVNSRVDYKTKKHQMDPLHRDSEVVRFFHNLFVWFRFQEDYELRDRCGREVAVYSRFQKMMIVTVMIMMVLALVVCIPIHTTGTTISPTNFQDNGWFLFTTIQTVVDDELRLIPHVILCWVFTGLVITMIHLFLKSPLVKEYKIPQPYPLLKNYAVMFTRLPKNILTQTQLTQHLAMSQPMASSQTMNAAPGAVAINPHYSASYIQLPSTVYTSRVVMKAYKQRVKLHQKLVKLNSKVEKYKAHPYGRNYQFVCIPTNQTSLDYYTQKRDRIAMQIRQWDADYNDQAVISRLEAANTQPGSRYVVPKELKSTRHGFAVFSNTILKNDMVAYFRRDYGARTAPEPEDIQWNNFFMPRWLKAIIRTATTIGFILFVIFFSTPLSVVTSITQFSGTTGMAASIENGIRGMGTIGTSFVLQYFPTLFLMMISALIPIFIVKAVAAEKKLTNSSERISVMRRIWFYLFLNVLLIPSIGLSSLEAFAQSTLASSLIETFERLFLPSGGVFFVNFIIQAALVGQLLALFRPFQHFTRYKAKSIESQALNPVFRFEIEYANIIAISSITFCYSLMIPLITVVGFGYLLIKFFIDRHNFIFVYRRSERHIAKSMEPYYSRFIRTLVTLILVDVMIFQFAMGAFFATKRYTGLYVTTFVLFGLTVIYTVILNLYIHTKRHTMFREVTDFTEKSAHVEGAGTTYSGSSIAEYLYSKYKHAYDPYYELLEKKGWVMSKCPTQLGYGHGAAAGSSVAASGV